MADKPKRVATLVEEEADDDLLLADFRRSQMHMLNPTAAVVWDLCDGENSVEEIAGLIAEHFSLQVTDVLGDVEKVLGGFRENAMIE